MKVEMIFCDQCGAELMAEDRHWTLVHAGGSSITIDLCGGRKCLAGYAAWMARPLGVEPNFKESRQAADKARRV